MERQNFVYPKEYTHLQEQVKVAKEHIKAYEEKIDKAEDDTKSPQPQFRPKGMPPFEPHQTRDEKIESYEHQISAIKKEVLAKADKDLMNAAPKTAQAIKNDMNKELNLSEGKTEKQSIFIQQPSRSNEFFSSFLYNQRNLSNDIQATKAPDVSKNKSSQERDRG